MSKEIGQVKIFKTDNGFSVNFEGDLASLGCCCGCAPEKGKSESSGQSCCEPGEKKSE